MRVPPIITELSQFHTGNEAIIMRFKGLWIRSATMTAIVRMGLDIATLAHKKFDCTCKWFRVTIKKRKWSFTNSQNQHSNPKVTSFHFWQSLNFKHGYQIIRLDTDKSKIWPIIASWGRSSYKIIWVNQIYQISFNKRKLLELMVP